MFDSMATTAAANGAAKKSKRSKAPVQTITKTKIKISSATLALTMIATSTLLLGLFSSLAATSLWRIGEGKAFGYEIHDLLGVGDYGVVENLTHKWQTVEFLRAERGLPTYTSAPVVIAKPVSRNGGDPSHIRIKDVTATSFKLKVEEWAYQPNRNHTRRETVSFWVMPVGEHDFDDEPGAEVQAGRIQVSHVWNKNDIDLSSLDEDQPIVFTQSQTFNDSDPIVTRNKFVFTELPEPPLPPLSQDADGGCLEEQQGDFRCIHFDATHSGPVNWTQECRNGAWFNVEGCSSCCVEGECIDSNVSISFWTRVQEEEGCTKPETNSCGHAVETVGYIALIPFSGTLNGLKIDIGTVEEVRGMRKNKNGKWIPRWKTIAFGQTFDQFPTFLADMQTTNGSDTAGLRYRRLGNDSVQVFVEEETSKDSERSHTNETVGYIAFERPQMAKAKLMVYEDTSVVSQSVIVGGRDYIFAGIKLDTSGSDVGVFISELRVKINTEGVAPAAVSNFKVYDGDTQLSVSNDPDSDVSSHTNPGDSAVVEFILLRPLDTLVEPDQIKTLYIKADVSASATSGTYQVGPSQSLQNSVVAAHPDVVPGFPVDLSIEWSDGPEMTFVSSGELTITQHTDTPEPGLIPANTSYVPLAMFVALAINEDISIEKIYVTGEQVNNGGWDQIDKLYLYKNSELVAQVTPTSTDGHERTVLFDLTNDPLVISKDTLVTLTFKADTSDSNYELNGMGLGIGASGEGIKLKINSGNDVVAKGAQSGMAIDVNAVNAYGNAQYLFRSVPVVEQGLISSGDLGPGPVEYSKKLYEFSVTADQAGDIGLNEVAFEIISENVDVTNLALYSSSVYPSALVEHPGNIFTLTDFRAIIPAGYTEDFILMGDIHNCHDQASLTIRMLGDSTFPSPLPTSEPNVSSDSHFVWTDFWRTPILRFASTTASITEQWSNGYLVALTNGSHMVPTSTGVSFSGQCPSSIPIVISDVISNPSTTSAFISFHTEGRTSSNPSVEYGLTASYGDVSSCRVHDITDTGFDSWTELTGLSAGDTYHYRVVLDRGSSREYVDPNDYTFDLFSLDFCNNTNPASRERSIYVSAGCQNRLGSYVDYCIGDTVVDYGCGSDYLCESIEFLCHWGCQNGRCIEPPEGTTCYESDDGDDIYQQGTAESNLGSPRGVTDHCVDGDKVFEYFCNQQGNLTQGDRTCPNGCEDGACLSE